MTMSDADTTTGPSDIAIVGMACRFEQADGYQALRRNLAQGRECIARPTRAELQAAGVPADLLDHPNYVAAGGPLAGLEDFDADFFGMPPREADLLDPQQRLFLECAWEALEDAGLVDAVAGQPVGVWGGTATNLYLLHNLQHAGDVLALMGGINLTIATKPDFVTLRVSHLLDLRGPSLNVQSGCSTGLSAVHCGVQSLLSGETRVAVCGAASLTQLQPGGYVHQPGSIESPDGHCRAFDADAAGTCRGSGAAVVVMKRLADALADGDPIHAVIKASASNNDGADKIGFTAPGELGQAAVIEEALALAGLSADAIGCVEAHGTGTRLGDPIEVAALTRAFRRSTDKRGYCAIGSLKSNLGHLDAAAGIASLVKAVLMVSNREIYQTLHFTAPNPEIDFAASPLRVAQRYETWNDAVPRAGVSSFGMGGTNVHVIVQAPPERPVSVANGAALLLPLSARTQPALAAQAQRLLQALENNPALALADVAHTLQVGRRHFSCRRFVVAATAAQAIAALRDGGSGLDDPLLHATGLRWSQGGTIDWSVLPGMAQARRVHLPTYPFERRRHWIDRPAADAAPDLQAVEWRQQALPPAVAPARWWLLPDTAGQGDAQQAASTLVAQGHDARVQPAGAANVPLNEAAIAVTWPGVTWMAPAQGPVRHIALVRGTAGVLGNEALDAHAAAAVALATPATFVDVEPAATALPLARLAGLGLGHFAWRGRQCFAVAPRTIAAARTVGVDGTCFIDGGLQTRGPELARALLAGGAAELLLRDEDPRPARDTRAVLDALDAAAGAWTRAPRAPELDALLDRLATAWTCRWLRAAGVDLAPGNAHAIPTLLEQVGVVPAYHRMVRAQLADLADDGLVRLDADRFEVLPALAQAPGVEACRADILQRLAAQQPLLDLLDHCASRYADVFTGRLHGTAVIASEAGGLRFAAATRLLQEQSSRPHCLHAVAGLVARLAQGLPRPLRILEVAGGTGSLTGPVLARLAGTPVEYCFTDIGQAFLARAAHEAQRQGLAGFTTRRFDMAQEPAAQGFTPGSYDLVLGLDGAHVPADMRRTLEHLGQLLRPDGVLCLVERMRTERWVDRIWGLESGWWDFADSYRGRSPLAAPSAWRQAVQDGGLHLVALRAGSERDDTGWLLATPQVPSILPAAFEGARLHRLRTFDGLQAEAQALGARVDLLAPDAPCPPCALAARVDTGADDLAAAQAFVAAARGHARRTLLVAAGSDAALAAGHAVLAQGEADAVAWSGVDAITPLVLQAVLAAGAPVVRGAVAPAPTAVAPAPAATTETPQDVVLRLWGELLGREGLRPDDDWYAVGGDSLLTTRIIVLLEQRFGVSLPAERFFSATTAADMAHALEDTLGQRAQPADDFALDLLARIEAMSDAEAEAALRQGTLRA